jgi:superfamily II DNA/RNA helicase
MSNLNENKLLKPNNSGKIIGKSYQRSMEELTSTINISDEILNEIRNGSRKQFFTPIKLKFIKAVLNKKYCVKKISQFLNAAPSAISKISPTIAFTLFSDLPLAMCMATNNSQSI